MEYLELIDIFIPLACVVLGAFIGYAVDVRKNDRKKHADYNMIIFETYKDISKEIIEALAPLTSLSLRYRGLTAEELEEWRKKISDLYFKHYTYLPQSVLNEMDCLHSCIQTGGKDLYCVKNKNEVKACEREDVINLFKDTELVGGEYKRIEGLVKEYGVEKLSESLKINLQARRVIHIIAAIFEDKKVNDWDSILKKETLLQARSTKA